MMLIFLVVYIFSKGSGIKGFEIEGIWEKIFRGLLY